MFLGEVKKVEFFHAKSGKVLLALVDSGLARDDAYRVVQRDARRAWEEGRALRAVLEEDAEVQLDAVALDAAFDLERVLRHRRRFLDALAVLDQPPTDEPASDRRPTDQEAP